MEKTTLIAATALIALIPFSSHACAEHEAQNQRGRPSLASVEPASGETADLYEHSRHSMHEAMNVAPSGNPDIDFVKNMIPHHEGALDMAKVQLEHGTDPELRKLAEDIIAAQEKEIAQMKAWLENHPQK